MKQVPSGGVSADNAGHLRGGEERFDSTSDERVSNNVLRHEYRKLDEAGKQQMQAVKDKSLELYELIASMGGSREISLALTKVEEATMWAVKHVTSG